MKKIKYTSLIHQFYKELKICDNKGYSIFVPLKYFFNYLSQNRIKRDGVEKEEPWLTVPAVNFLKKRVNKSSRVFEYGCGGSTLFFAKMCGELVSIEHDIVWFEKINSIINDRRYSNVKLYLQEPVISELNKNAILSNKDQKYLDKDYSSYVLYINNYPDKYFDFIVIDGRARMKCLEVSLSKLKPGGFLIFDNAEREEYQNGLDSIQEFLIFSEYTVGNYSLSFFQTNIYHITV